METETNGQNYVCLMSFICQKIFHLKTKYILFWKNFQIYFVFKRKQKRTVKIMSVWCVLSVKKLPFKNQIVKLAKTFISILHGTHGGILIPLYNSYLKFSLTVNIMIRLVFIIRKKHQSYQSLCYFPLHHAFLK